MCSPRRRRGTPSKYMRNLLQPMPLHKKVRLLLRNMTSRTVHLSLCCGHPGEPGC